MSTAAAMPRLSSKDPALVASRELAARWAGAYLKSGHALHLFYLTEAVRSHVERFGELPRAHGYLWRIDSCGEVCKHPAARRPAPRGAGNFRAAYRVKLSGRKGVAE